MATRHYAGATVALLLAGGACIRGGAQAPAPDFDHLGAYMHALKSSKDPEAQTILKQIADGPADLAREKAACEQAGIPTTMAKPSIPADQNAAPLYEQWRGRLEGDHVLLPPYAQPLSDRHIYTPDQIARVQDVFDKHHEVFDLLEQATDKAHFVAAPGSYAHFAGMREAARELMTQTYLLRNSARSPYVSPGLRARLYDQAIKTNARSFRIAEQVADQTTNIRYLVGVAIESIGLTGFRQTLAAAGPDVDVDTQILHTIQKERPNLSLKEAMTGDAAEILLISDSGRTSSPSGLVALTGEESAKSALLPLTPDERQFSNNILDAAEAEYLAQQRKAVSIAGLPADQRRKVFADAVKQSSLDDAKHSRNPCFMLAASGIDLASTMADKDDKLHADEEVLMASATILAEKGRTGQFPSAMPGGFIDPFNGKPLGYRREGAAGFVVYSVGKDGTFSGGKPGEIIDATKTLFRYPAAAPKLVPAS